MATIPRRAYAEVYGPTVGDQLRLADTALIIEVEADHTLRAGGYGDEVKFSGIKRHRIVAIGKAGNPDLQPGVDIVIGPGTEILSAEGLIVTAGGIDSHIHFLCPQQIDEALYSGVHYQVGRWHRPGHRHPGHRHARP